MVNIELMKLTVLRVLYTLFRVKSRVLEVPFSRPKVAPANKVEREKRREMETKMVQGHFGSALGWVVGLGAQLRQGEGEVERLYEQISEWGRLKEEPRICQGWALAIFFAGKVCYINY